MSKTIDLNSYDDVRLCVCQNKKILAYVDKNGKIYASGLIEFIEGNMYKTYISNRMVYTFLLDKCKEKITTEPEFDAIMGLCYLLENI
jgi:hypothetical protein